MNDDPTRVLEQDPRRGLSRRAFLASSATAGAVGVLGGFLARTPAASATAPADATGTIADLKHVVLLMQENRSFDQFFGALPGVRGFGDKQALTFQNGLSVFHQPDTSRPDGGYLLPFRMESGKVNGLAAPSLDHGWVGTHRTYNHGGWDQWVPIKTQATMGYFTEDDVPWHYALADAWTVADHYHCAVLGPTVPNRCYQWSATIDPSGASGGPQITNTVPYFSRTWRSYAEVLEQAGVTWDSYTNERPHSEYNGDVGNGLRIYQPYQAAAMSSDPTVRRLADRADIHLDSAGNFVYPAPAGDGRDLEYALRDFIADCANNALPEVSYITAPSGWSEHPAHTERGVHYTYRIIQALASNPDVWNSTLLIVNYDENDGLFDHVPPPVPEPGTPDEFIDGEPIGPGPRVPLLLISPWTRGGWVASEVFDHTSPHQFIEHWLTTRGYDAESVRNPNITDWRRTISGDLLSAIDFANADYSVPDLPDSAPVVDAVALDATLPAAAPPAVGKQVFPAQASGHRKSRPVPYQQHASIAVDRAGGQVTATLRNDGDAGVSMLVYPDQHLPFRSTPYTVVKGTPRTHTWDATATGGDYAFTIYGPDRFVRSFAGTVAHAEMGLAGIPTVAAELVSGGTGTLRLTLGNDGLNELRYMLTPHDYEGTERSVFVGGRQTRTVEWPTDADGYYDVVITDSSDTGFRQRYAGRIS